MIYGCFYAWDIKLFLQIGGPLQGLGVRFGLIEGTFRADPYQNWMAVSINWGSFKGVGGLI